MLTADDARNRLAGSSVVAGPGAGMFASCRFPASMRSVALHSRFVNITGSGEDHVADGAKDAAGAGGVGALPAGWVAQHSAGPAAAGGFRGLGAVAGLPVAARSGPPVR